MKNAKKKMHPIERVARFHLEFEGIHPFIDENGRCGRLLLNLVLIQNGYPAINVKFTGRKKYYEAFDAFYKNNLKYVAEKDKKVFANDLKSIYHAPNEENGYERMQDVTEKWQDRYPNAMKRWEENWDVISPMFKFSADVRKVMYATNAIESLNSALRRLNSQRRVFPSDTALLKALYLASFEVTKKWTMPLRNWGKVYGELFIMYDGRL